MKRFIFSLFALVLVLGLGMVIPAPALADTSYALDVTIIGNGSVTKAPDQPTYAADTVVELTATPASGWSFSTWSGDLTGTTNPDSITMDSNKTVTATFTQEVAISVSPVSVNFGTILPGRDVTGSVLNITNTGSAKVKVTTEIREGATSFYTDCLYLEGTDAEDWAATIGIGSSITVSPKLKEVLSNLEPGTYSCTVIFWAEAAP